MARPYPLYQHLALDRERGDIVGQLCSQLRSAVLAGVLARDDRLPSSREIAAALGIARGTATEAYARLAADGILVTRPGAGTFVGVAGDGAGLEPLPPRRHPARRHEPLTPGLPALSLFPIPQWTRLYARMLRQHARELLHYGEPQGYLPLREAIAVYLRAMRGILADPADIVVSGGTVAAIALVATALRTPGSIAWVEDPGHPPARMALEQAGIGVAACPVDSGGINIAAAARAVPHPRLALVTPAHQYPLGAALLPERKLELLRLARARDFFVLEDDYDHEFRYDGEPGSPLKAMAPERVIYLGTFSKLLAPGLRLGFIVAPPELVPKITALKAASDRHPPTCDQATAAAFIDEGHLAAHVRRMRAVYAERRAALLEALGDGLEPWGKAPAPAYGLQMPLRLPEACDAETVAGLGAEAGLGAMALDRFWLDCRPRDTPPGLLVGYADSDPGVLKRSIARLRAIIRRSRSA
jgi:GntR family transcriptional regulator / MocR family aminotransferase